MNSSARIVLIVLVFALSTLFFWNAINGYLLQSRADSATDVEIFPFSSDVVCNPRGECYVQVMGTTAAENGLAGVSGVLTYGEYLVPDRIDSIGVCANSSFGLSVSLKFAHDPAARKLAFATGSIEHDRDLVGGTKCITTVVFKASGAPVSSISKSSVSFEPGSAWKVGGRIGTTRGILNPRVNTQQVVVTLDPNAPLEDTPAPKVPGTCKKNSVDCNCDGAIDLVDFEVLRGVVYDKQVASCDANGDGATDELDMVRWMEDAQIMHKKYPTTTPDITQTTETEQNENE